MGDADGKPMVSVGAEADAGTAALAALRAIGQLEDRAALADWARANEPHFVSLAATYPEAVARVREAITERRFEPLDGEDE